jgi:hypothetical protein
VHDLIIYGANRISKSMVSTTSLLPKIQLERSDIDRLHNHTRVVVLQEEDEEKRRLMKPYGGRLGKLYPCSRHFCGQWSSGHPRGQRWMPAKTVSQSHMAGSEPHVQPEVSNRVLISDFCRMEENDRAKIEKKTDQMVRKNKWSRAAAISVIAL